MYGLVNRAIEELTIRLSDVGTWEDIKQVAGVDVPKFLSMEPYPDEMSYALVAAASERLGMTGPEFLRALGRHWILFTGSEGYGGLLESAGGDMRALLTSLDVMHGHLASSLPELRPPSISVEPTDCKDTLLLHYHSTRSGLAPMVVGLLEGLSEKFATPCEVQQVAEAGVDDHDIFELTFTGQT